MTQETLEELAEKLQEEIKYGASISDIIDTLTKWQQQNSNVNALHFEIDSLKREIKVLKHQQERSYSEEDLIEFSEWVSHNDWVYLPRKNYWVNEEQEELEQKFTTKKLFEKFKNK